MVIPLNRERRWGEALPGVARVTGGMAGNLFLRSFERADRIYAAMLSRGYDGEVRACCRCRPSRQAQWIVLALGLVTLALAGCWRDILFWG